MLSSLAIVITAPATSSSTKPDANQETVNWEPDFECLVAVDDESKTGGERCVCLSVTGRWD